MQIVFLLFIHNVSFSGTVSIIISETNTSGIIPIKMSFHENTFIFMLGIL